MFSEQSMQDGVAFRERSRRMAVRTEWTFKYVKQGGTAGIVSCPGIFEYALGRAFLFVRSKYIEKGELENERKQNSLQNLS